MGGGVRCYGGLVTRRLKDFFVALCLSVYMFCVSLLHVLVVLPELDVPISSMAWPTFAI